MTKVWSLPSFHAVPLPFQFRQRQRTDLSRRRKLLQCINRPLTCACIRDYASSEQVASKTARIVCVGDIHGQWDIGDERALKSLNPDLVMFVGDYGNEDVRVTQRIADLADSSAFGVATVFGNHDAFFTATQHGRSRAPYDKTLTCRVTEQKRMLARYDVSYRSIPFDNIGASVCGGRSWSWGGPHWKHRDFYRNFEGVTGMDDSARRIVNAVNAAEHDVMIFLCHSGPFGLGAHAWDPCGRDWGASPGGDYGDRDLREGIEFARTKGMRVPLVVFGHMHKALLNGQGSRTMLVTEKDGETGKETVMLNAAVVPRHRKDPRFCRTIHNFQIVEFGEGSVSSVEEAWVAADGTKSFTNFLYNRDGVAAKAAVG